jgi:hypothetical protein
MPKPAPIPTITTLGEIVGWKVWRIQDTDTFDVRTMVGSLHDPYLHSPLCGDLWIPDQPLRRNENRYRYGNGIISSLSAPGIYAWKTKYQALKYMVSLEKISRGKPEQLYTVGEVELWGEVWEHNRGYRAEWASIKSILPPAYPSRDKDIIARRHPDTALHQTLIWRYLNDR